jgi:hypothetical protein
VICNCKLLGFLVTQSVHFRYRSCLRSNITFAIGIYGTIDEHLWRRQLTTLGLAAPKQDHLIHRQSGKRKRKTRNMFKYIYVYIEPSPQEIKKRDVVTDTHVFLFPHIPERWFLLLYCISQRKRAILLVRRHGIADDTWRLIHLSGIFLFLLKAILSSL